jgi:ubiquinone/menaquinone biosynthesis C-methylase UbiE
MDEASTLSARLEVFRDRTLAYRKLGYDRFGAAGLVAEMAGPIQGPALDIGTGKAVMASTLAATCAVDVVTVDVVDADRELAELVTFEAGVRERVGFVRADAAHMPFADGYFGCAVMMDALHHMSDATSVLREMARVVATNKVIVLADFTEEGFRVLEAVLGTHPRSGFTIDRAVEHAARAGLKCVMRAEGFMHQVAVFRNERRATRRTSACPHLAPLEKR